MAGSEIAPVLVSIVSYNDEAFLEPCLQSVLAQTVPVRVKVLDNASTDSTVQIARTLGVDLVESERNLGYGAGHNRNLAGEDFPAALLLNPDTILRPDFIERLLAALAEVEGAGMAGGKLLRMDGRGRRVLCRGHALIDSTGIYFTPSMRHFDRGSQQEDQGQFDRRQLVFGITGAAVLCSREMIRDISLDGEFFDEDFFLYREDADLAWRAQLRGWKTVYEPEAVALHRRTVFPNRRRQASRLANLHSLKNRYLMRRKNMDSAVRRRCFPYMVLRDLGILAYVAFLEWGSWPAYWRVWKLREKFRRKRQLIQSTRRIRPDEMAWWFSFKPRVKTCPGFEPEVGSPPADYDV